MSDRQHEIPFCQVVELCQRHGYVLLRIVGRVRVFHNPRSAAPADPRNWCAIEVGTNRCVKPEAYERLREFLEGGGGQGPMRFVIDDGGTDA